MSTDHTLQRLLGEISKHKEELREVPPDDDLGQAEGKSPEEKEGKSIEEVADFFNDEALESRQEQEKLADASDRVPKPPQISEQEIGHPNHTSLDDLPPEVREELEEEKEKYEFRSVFDFKDFILMFYDRFDDFQKAALNSIVTVCETIDVGCKCKKKNRLKIAEDYYVEFITQNQHSGIVEKFMKLLNTKRIKFYSKDKLFLER
jgi:hypothetical protein